jgi:predicted ATP-grasp superfamily ATP-dependent carboligase
MSADVGSLLILANSGRAIAESARRGGYRVTVLDGFCDQDTLAVADCWPVTQGFAHLDVDMFVQEMASLMPEHPCGLVYGAGLEESATLLDRLSGCCRLLGNDPSVLELIRRPRRFFALLNRLRIPHPEVSFVPPYSTAEKSWLIKRSGSCGGQGVAYFSSQHSAADPYSYYQKYIPGQVMSILFIADGRRHRTIGFNRLGLSASNAPAPFLYNGAIGQGSLREIHRARVEGIAEKLVSELGLRGVNSIDFVLGDDGVYVIDINPRPTATLELYEHLLTDGWIKHHIQACLGELPVVPFIGSTMLRGHQIVYAPRTLEIPGEISWPEWIKDRPAAGSRIVAGQPICSLFASAASVEQLEAALSQYQYEILLLLGASRQQSLARKVAV